MPTADLTDIEYQSQRHLAQIFKRALATVFDYEDCNHWSGRSRKGGARPAQLRSHRV